MTFSTKEPAELAMNALAEVSRSPIVALVCCGEAYRVAEADENGVFVILPTETILDTTWTASSGGVTQLDIVNAYSIGFCYNSTYSNTQSIRVPHGTSDLRPFLDDAMTKAHDTECWRACDDAGPTFVDAISHGDDVCPWSDELPIPEVYSERGERPVIVVRKQDDNITNVIVEQGEVHVLIVDGDGKLISRCSPDQAAGQTIPAFGSAINAFAAEDLLHDIHDEIKVFDEVCSETQDTDTGVVWEMFNSMRTRILATVGEPPKRLPF